jgi:PPM family protein phosphatase
VTRIETAVVVEQASALGQDRAAVDEVRFGSVLVVADGAGGTGGGAEAAEEVVAATRRWAASLHVRPNDQDVAAHLRAVDRSMASSRHGGQAAVVVVIATPDRLFGASAGDCEAVAFDGDVLDVLRSEQRRKPLIGSGAARVTPFDRIALPRTLVVGSDGVFRYVEPGRVRDLCATDARSDAIARSLVDAARLPNGRLQDDASVIVVHGGRR